jgi:hypothetical protein
MKRQQIARAFVDLRDGDDSTRLQFTPKGVLDLAAMLTLDGWLDPAKFDRLITLSKADKGARTTDGGFRIWEDIEWRKLWTDVVAGAHDETAACGGTITLADCENPPRGPFFDHPEVQELREAYNSSPGRTAG